MLELDFFFFFLITKQYAPESKVDRPPYWKRINLWLIHMPWKVAYFPMMLLPLQIQLFPLPSSKAPNRIGLNRLRIFNNHLWRGSTILSCRVANIWVEEVGRWNFKHYSMSLPVDTRHCKKGASCVAGPIRNRAWEECWFKKMPMS